MCLYSKTGIIKTAKKDIKCYKVLETYKGRRYKFRSPFMDHKYYFNTLYKAKLVSEGVHGSDLIRIDEGLHAFTSKEEARMLQGRSRVLFIFKAIIPKGSLYCKGLDRDIVSNQLIILDKEIK